MILLILDQSLESFFCHLVQLDGLGDHAFRFHSPYVSISVLISHTIPDTDN